MSLIPKDFYFSHGLYQRVTFSEDDFDKLFNLIFAPGRLDLYCPVCQKETTFEAYPRREKKDNSTYAPAYGNEIYTLADFKEKFDFKYFHNGRRFELNYKCTREPYSDHLIYFQMAISNGAIMKIGQFPSVADLNQGESKRFEKVLPREYYKEFSKAVGLFSHGVGIGSFVYLRRIFERLIYETYDSHGAEIGLARSDFNKLRMGEKIGILNAYLPTILVENKSLYGILSNGIHSLDENTCKEYFPIVRAGIELILDERIEQLYSSRSELCVENVKFSG